MDVIIRPTKTISDYLALEQLQAEIWGTQAGVVPTPLLLTMAKEGGVVLIAFDGDQPVGFAYGFVGLTDGGRLKLASHQAGVLPDYQDSGLGYQIKLAQRKATLARNIDHMTWTFDPLQGRNARFNLHKLGAVANVYYENLYGEMDDELNHGLPTDRLQADWWLNSEHVIHRIADDREPARDEINIPILNPSVDGHTPSETVHILDGRQFLVEIPADINALRRTRPDLAMAWQAQARTLLREAFALDYTAVDLLRRGNRNYYLLQIESNDPRREGASKIFGKHRGEMGGYPPTPPSS